jgi:hypothetical protein
MGGDGGGKGGHWTVLGNQRQQAYINRHGMNGKRNLGRPWIEDAARTGILCVPLVRLERREPAWGGRW